MDTIAYILQHVYNLREKWLERNTLLFLSQHSFNDIQNIPSLLIVFVHMSKFVNDSNFCEMVGPFGFLYMFGYC